MVRFHFTLLFFFTILFKLTGSHILGGDIGVVHSVHKTYEITLTLYLDSLSVSHSNLLEEKEVLINLGDGNELLVPMDSKNYIGNNTIIQSYKTTYTYHSNGPEYVISVALPNRSNNIVNISKGNSTDQVAFVIYAFIQTGISSGATGTPKFSTYPVLTAAPGRRFEYQMEYIAIDSTDSLAFEIIPPKTIEMTDVPDYLIPSDPVFNGKSLNGNPATFTILPSTNKLVWETPSDYYINDFNYSNYAIAIKLSEYRKVAGTWELIGYTVRDINIVVSDKYTSTARAMSPSIKIYPNPAADHLYLEVPDPFLNSVKVTMHSVEGKIYDFSTNTSLSVLPLNSLPSGVYMIKINAREYGFQEKLVKY